MKRDNCLLSTIFDNKNGRFRVIKKHPYFVNRNSIKIEMLVIEV